MTSGIYNMGFGTAMTWLDLAGAMFKSMDRPMNIDWIELPQNLEKQYQYFTEAKMNRAHQSGLSLPHWSLEVGIEDYVKKHLFNSDPYL